MPKRMRAKQNLNMFEREWEEAKTYLVPPQIHSPIPINFPKNIQRKTNENKFTTNNLTKKKRQPTSSSPNITVPPRIE